MFIEKFNHFQHYNDLLKIRLASGRNIDSHGYSNVPETNRQHSKYKNVEKRNNYVKNDKLIKTKKEIKEVDTKKIKKYILSPTPKETYNFPVLSITKYGTIKGDNDSDTKSDIMKLYLKNLTPMIRSHNNSILEAYKENGNPIKFKYEKK